MKTKIRRILAAAVSAVMMTGLMTVGAYAAGLSYRDLNGVTWSYAGDGDTALESIRDSGQTIEQAQALLIPASVDGIPVDAVRSNGFDNVVVGHRANEYILLPEGIREVGGMTFYDFNYAKGVSIPASVTTVDYNAFDVLGREIRNATVIYGAAGSEAERWAGDNSTAVYAFAPVDGANFTAAAGEGGVIWPNGSWYVPDGMKADGVGAAFSVMAEEGCVIESLMADGETVPAAAGQSEYLLAYTFSQASEAITVTFAPDGAASSADSASEDGGVIELAAGETAAVAFDGAYVPLLDGAAAATADLSDIYDAPAEACPPATGILPTAFCMR